MQNRFSFMVRAWNNWWKNWEKSFTWLYPTWRQTRRQKKMKKDPAMGSLNNSILYIAHWISDIKWNHYIFPLMRYLLFLKYAFFLKKRIQFSRSCDNSNRIVLLKPKFCILFSEFLITKKNHYIFSLIHSNDYISLVFFRMIKTSNWA